MAIRIETTLIDDLDGTTAEETVRFSLDGTAYEIDLTEEHAAELRQGLGRFTNAARKVTGSRRASAPATGAKGREHTQQIRAWAQQHGITVNARGRINASVMEAYEKANGS